MGGRSLRNEGGPAGPQGLPLVVALDPLDPAAEAYRNLRVNLMFMSNEEAPIRSVLFSSPGPSEGKSTSSIALSPKGTARTCTAGAAWVAPAL